MNIVQLVNTLEVGGTERLVVHLASALKDRGHRLTVVCLRASGDLEKPLASAGIEVVALEKAEGPNLGAMRKFVRCLKDRKVDVVHSHNPLVHHYALAAGRLAGVPAIVNTIHGLSNLAEKPGLKERLYSLTCRFSSRIVAVCPMAYRSFAAGGIIPRAKLLTINNGIPLQSFLEVPPAPAGHELVFGIVGRLQPVKDHASLLAAFATVLRVRPDCRLEILGDGPCRADLEKQAKSLGIDKKVVFHGFRSDVANFLATIDISVLCSTSEGLPLGVLESMAAGRTIVGTDVGGMRDLIEGGRCGWLCPPGRPDLLAQEMLTAANTPADVRAQMGKLGREHAVAHYSLTQMTDGYESLFSSHIGRRS